MDAPWPRTWPEMAVLHVFDPEGDVLLILERCLKEDDLVESVDEEKSESVPAGGFISENGGAWVEDEAPPPSADVPDWPESEQETVPCEPQTEFPGAEVDSAMKPEIPASASLASREKKPRAAKVQMRT
jgi:hypothetical protein